MRERILAAAFAEFMERGYGRTSTLDIATRAHVSKRDLYAQFGSKQAMLAACIASRAERMRMPLSLPLPQERAALVDTLTMFGTTVLREVSRPEVLAVFRLAIAEAEASPDVARTLDDVGPAATRRALTALLTGAQSNGLLGSGPAEAMADAFLAMLWSGGLQMRLLLRLGTAPSAQECDARARAATEALLRLYPASVG